MKKLFKVLGITLGVLVILLLIVVISLLKSLPSAGEVGQYLRPSNTKSALKAIDKKKDLPPTTTAEATPPVAAKDSSDNFTYKLESEEDRKLMADITDNSKPLSEVCAHLKNARKIHLDGYSLKDFGQGYKDSVMTDDKDPVVQAIKPSLRYVFNQPHMRDLMKSAVEAAEKGETSDSIIDKAGFYSQAFAAYREIDVNKENIEHIMDRSYHLMILGKVIAKRPDLANDPAVNNYCADIEAALNTSNPVAFAEERQAFNEFMQETGVDPKDVGYDPDYRTQLKIKMTSGNIQMNGGWIDSIIKPTADEMKEIQNEVLSKK